MNRWWLPASVVLFSSAGVLAQTLNGAPQAVNELVQAGVLGAISVVLMTAVVYLQMRLDRLQDKHRAEILEIAKAQSSLLTENVLLQKQQNDLLTKMNEKLDRR